MNKEHKTVAKGTFWGLAGSISIKLVSFIYLIIVARLFTQADIGTFYLALSIVGMVTVFSDLGLGSAFSRYVPFYCGRGENEKAYMLLKASYLVSGLLSLLLAIAFFFLSQPISDSFSNPALAVPLRFLSAFLFVNTFFSLNISFLLGRKKVKENNIILSGQNVLKLILTIALFLSMGATQEALALSFVLSYALAAIASFWYVRRDVEGLGLKGSASSSLKDQISPLKEIIPFGIVLSLTLMFWSVITYTDRIMLGYLLPVEVAAAAIGVYTISTTLATLIPVFPSAVSSIFFPMISELHGQGRKEELAKLSVSAMRWMIFLMVPLTIVLVSFPQEILQLFYGASYMAGASVLVIFSAGIFIRLLSTVHGSILAALRLVRIELYAAGGAALVNVALNFMLIPSYGIEGAALASAVSFVAITLLMVYYSRKMFGIGFSRETFKPLFAALLVLALIIILKPYAASLFGWSPALPFLSGSLEAVIAQKIAKLAIFGVLFISVCLLYLAALILLKSIKEEDVEILSSAMRKAKAPEGVVSFTESMFEWGME